MDQVERQSPTEIMDNFDPFDEGDGEAHSFEDFPPQITADVDGLMWLGHLEDHFEYCGHTFTIRTLHGDEELLAGLVTKEFVETLGQARAWVWAKISLSLLSVDGDKDFCPPISTNKRDFARARFQYCIQNWFWPLATYINTKLTELEERQREALERVEDLSKGSPHTFTPFADSSIDSGDSGDQPEQSTQSEEDIRMYLDPQDSTDSNSDSSAS